MKYLSLTPKTGLTVQERQCCPTAEALAEFLGQSTPLDRTNYLHDLFSDPALVILRSNAIALPWVAVVNRRQHLFGPLVVFRKIPHTWGHELIGLTGHQIATVRQELRLERSLPKPLEVPSCA